VKFTVQLLHLKVGARDAQNPLRTCPSQQAQHLQRQDHEENLMKLRRWEAKGIQLDPYGVGNGYAIFYTYDEKIALEEGFERIRTESGNTLPRR
jgi:hypothetical protein